MIYRKYEFENEAVARQTLPNCIQVHLWQIVLTDAVMDGEEIITPAVLSTQHAVDCLLTPQQAADLTPFEVWPANPKHHISGWENQYQIDLQNRQI